MLRELGYCSDMTATPRPAEFSFIGRIPVTEVFPVIEDGRWPTKAVVGETIPIRATVFREGHDAFAATAILVRPDGTDGPRANMYEIAMGLNRYEARLTPDEPGAWSFRLRAGLTPTPPGSMTPHSRCTPASTSN